MTTVEDFAKNPDELLDLVRQVIEHLVAEDHHSGIASMQAQLHEISRAIENLEKRSIHIPDVLRAEKTRLAAAVSVQSESALALNHLTEGLMEILNKSKPATNRIIQLKNSKRTGKKRSTSPKTSGKIIREHIIEALRHYGGSASKREVHKYLEEKLNEILLPGDMEWRQSTGNYAWQNNTDWERYHMIRDGVLKKGSQIGIWELSEDYR